MAKKKPQTSTARLENASRSIGGPLSGAPSKKFVREDIRGAYEESRSIAADLASITPVDLALAVPYVKITRIDPTTNKPWEGMGSLNLMFQAPPKFGVAMNEHVRFGDRPAVSLQNVVISSRLMDGVFTQRDIEISIVIHRPDALFGSSDESAWTSLITPGEVHMIEYGWAGGSKNPIMSGGQRGNVPGRTLEMMLTNRYSFNVTGDGSIELKVVGNQVPEDILSLSYLVDSLNRIVMRPGEEMTTEEEKKLTEMMRKETQEIVDGLPKHIFKIDGVNQEFVKFMDILDAFVSPALTRLTNWGFDDVALKVGYFNKRIPMPSKMFKMTKEPGEPGYNIGDFHIPLKIVKESMMKAVKAGRKITIRNFLMGMINDVIMAQTSWDPKPYIIMGKELQEEKPTISIANYLSIDENGKRILNFNVFDRQRDLVPFRDAEYSLFEDFSHERVKRAVDELGIPYISLGEGASYVKEASFEAIKHDDVQSVLLSVANEKVKDRQDLIGKTGYALRKESPAEFHKIFAAAVQGELKMMGNFAFDNFSRVYIDLGVGIWSGLFTIQGKTDEISPGAFETTVQVLSSQEDFLNARMRYTKDEIKKMDDEAIKRRDKAAAEAKKKQKR